MMEGISGEAASLAGHLKLANLCWIYDNNHITIEGNTALAYSDDVATRFIGYGWNVTRVGDANDLEMLERAFETFKQTTDRPTLVIVDSHIAYGAPHKQDTSAAHGEPLGREEIKLAKRNYGWPEDAEFLVPEGVREHFEAGIGARGQALHAAWWTRFEAYRREYPELAEQGYRMLRRELPDGWDKGLPAFVRGSQGPRDPRRIGPDVERAGRERAVAAGRVGRSRALVQDASELRRRRGFQRRASSGPESPLRHPGARHGRRAQRVVALEDSTVRVGIPDLQRLRPRGDPPERLDGASGRSTSSPTIRSAWGKTGRPTSRWSIWRPSARSPD